jgi:hypothetical protein
MNVQITLVLKEFVHLVNFILAQRLIINHYTGRHGTEVITHYLDSGGPGIYFRLRSPAILTGGFLRSCKSVLFKPSFLMYHYRNTKHVLTYSYLLHAAESLLRS